MNNKKFSKPEEQKILKETIDLYMKGALSLRGSAEYLSVKTGVKISHEGLRKIINKRATHGFSSQESSEG